MKQVVRYLNVFYYGFYAMTLLVAGIFWWGITREGWQTVEVQSALGQAIQTVVILYVIGSVAGSLWWFNRKLKTIRLIEDEAERLTTYKGYATVRISLIGAGCVMSIVAFYLLGGYRSMIWLAAVAMIGLYFTKPTERRIELELEKTEL